MDAEIRFNVLAPHDPIDDFNVGESIELYNMPYHVTVLRAALNEYDPSLGTDPMRGDKTITCPERPRLHIDITRV